MNKYIFLLPVLLAGILLNAYLHFGKPYPFHYDEWLHFSFAEEIYLTGRVPNYNPVFSGNVYPSTMVWEKNYHILLSYLFLLIPIEHYKIMSLIPILNSAVLMLSTFILFRYLTKSFSASLLASLLSATIKSNITLLGPLFAVPSSLILGVIPLLIFMILRAFYESSLRFFVVSLLVFLVSVFMSPHVIILLPIFAIFLILHPEMILRNKIVVLTSILSVVLVFSLFMPGFFSSPADTLSQFFNRFFIFSPDEVPVKFSLVDFIGFIPVLFTLTGFFFSLKDIKRSYSILFISMALCFLIIWIYYKYNISVFIFYRRAFLFLVEFSYMLAVLGAFKISQFFRKKYLLFIFGALILFQPLSSFFDFKDTIYELADSGDIVNFVWARQNLPENSIALADEKKSIALFSVSGIKTSFHDEAVTKIFDFPCINYNAITEKNIAYFYEPKNKCDFLADLGRGFYKVI